MKFVFLFLSLLTVSSVVLAQNIIDVNLVQYDPLFWKDKLKLDAEQCLKIKEINSEYYESLFTAYRQEKNDPKALRSIATKSLAQRSQEIWETFHPKQRKRWKRIWHASTFRERTNES